MDFSYLQNIMEPNDFVHLNKLDIFKHPNRFFSFKYKYPKIIDIVIKYFKENPKRINEVDTIIKWSVLMCAAMYGVSIVKNICELGANVNNNDENNWIALFYALLNNHIHSAKVLLEYDSTTNSKTTSGRSAISFGSRETQKEFAIMVENIRFLNIKN